MKHAHTPSRDVDAIGYLQNARELLRKSHKEGDRYVDIKYVREACGTAYLAILKAIDQYLYKKGLEKKELPQSVEGYRVLLQRYATIHNGRLLGDFEKLYDELHIAGYYRGLIRDVKAIKDIFESAQRFIKKLN